MDSKKVFCRGSVKNQLVWKCLTPILYNETCLLFEPSGGCSVLVGMLEWNLWYVSL